MITKHRSPPTGCYKVGEGLLVQAGVSGRFHECHGVRQRLARDVRGEWDWDLSALTLMMLIAPRHLYHPTSTLVQSLFKG